MKYCEALTDLVDQSAPECRNDIDRQDITSGDVVEDDDDADGNAGDDGVEC